MTDARDLRISHRIGPDYGPPMRVCINLTQCLFRSLSRMCVCPLRRSQVKEFTEIETMGDWATDSFDWDGTDVGLVGTGETAFDWLQKKGYVSLR